MRKRTILQKAKFFSLSGLLAFGVIANINLPHLLPASSQGKLNIEPQSRLTGNEQNPVGTLAGKFDVNSLGAATYTIPISAPPGTAGISPQLSVVYNSQQSNGLLGMGFSLEGLTAITRCDSNYAQNGENHRADNSYNDRFCLNGQQLVALKGSYGADGTEYRTFINSFSKIISYGKQGNGPAGFKVWTKGGQMAEYAFTNDSQIHAQGKDTVAIWALNKIIDTAGNYLTVKYIKDEVVHGEFHPQEIDYTGNEKAQVIPYNSVKFLYATRPDQVFSYNGGSLASLTERLNAIQTYAGSQLVSVYKFNYEQSPDTDRSRLTSIQHCDNANNCLPPTTFSWKSGGSHGWQYAPNFNPPDQLTSSEGYHAADLIDINGDGFADYVMSYKNPSGKRFVSSYINNGNGWTSAPNYNLPDVLTYMDGEQAAELVDLSGNGLPDFAMSFKAKGGNFYRVSYLNTGSGWQLAPQLNLPDVLTYIGNVHAADLVDINGDGLVDYVMAFEDKPGSVFKETKINIGGSWADAAVLPGLLGSESLVLSTFANLLGDARSDYVNSVEGQANATYHFSPSTNSWVQDAPLPVRLADEANGIQGYFVDLLGDGLDDYISKSGVWLNTGAGWERAPQYDLPSPLFDGKNMRGTFVDLLGNGLPAYIVAYDGDNRTWLNTGNGWKYAPNYNLPTSMHTNKMYVGQFADLNGDGFMDFAVAYYPNSSAQNTSQEKMYDDGLTLANAPKERIFTTTQETGERVYKSTGEINPGSTMVSGAWLNTSQKPDLLSGITDGYNANIYLTYKPLTDKSIYSKESGAQFPINDIQTPMYVVTQTQSENGSNTPSARMAQDSMHVTNYTYSGAKIHRQGFGFLGFHQITAVDQGTGIKTTTTYSQDVANHTIGQQLLSETYVPAPWPTYSVGNQGEYALLSSIQNILDTKIYGDGTQNKTYYFPYVKQKITKTWDYRDYNEDPINIKTTTTTLDDYGNPTTIIDSMQDDGIVPKVYTTTTQNTYDNYPDTWILGNLTQSTVTFVAPKQAAGMRTTKFNYDPNTGMLLQTIVSPDDYKYKLTTTFTRDVFGNIVKTSVSGADIEDRVTQNTYDAGGRFIVGTVNALGQATTQVVDPRFGKPLETTDLNGLKTSYQYDNFGNLILVINPDGTEASTTYAWCKDNCPNDAVGATYSIATHVTDGITKTIYFDKANHQIAETTQGMDGQLIWKTTQYDELGRIVSQSLPYFAGDPQFYKKFSYDILGRLVQTDTPDGAYTRLAYIQHTTITVNANDEDLTKVTDVRGNVISSEDDANNETQYAYDAYGNLTQTIDSYGRVISNVTYDKYGRYKTAVDDKDKGHWTYTYDVLGQLINQTDALGHTTSTKYDKLGRMISRTDPAGTSVWTYDTASHGIGKLAEVTGVAGLNGAKATGADVIKAARDNLISYDRTYAYDELSRPIARKATINGQVYISSIIYDKDSRPYIQTDAAGLQVKNTYNSLGFLISLNNAQTNQLYWKLNSEDASLHVLSETHSNGLVTNYTYDPETQYLTEIKTVLGSAEKIQQKLFALPTGVKLTKNPQNQDPDVIQDMQYVYDDIGNVLQRKDKINNRAETFSYDNLNRIKTNVVIGGTTQSYKYDDVGNLTYKSDVGNYKYGENGAGPHAVTSISGGNLPSTFQYNANGDQTSATINGISRTIDYTSFSKPKEIKQQDNSINFYYDADRNSFERVDQTATGKTTTLYLGGLELATHEDSKGTITEYKHYIGAHTLYITSTDGKQNTYGLLHDNLGSLTDIVDENSNVLQHFCYTPFGEQILMKGDAPTYPITHQGFTGHEEIEKIKLVHMGGRIYDPVIGRFLTADPFVQDPENGQSLNRYSYCLNNPLTFSDPSGFGWFSDVIHDIGKFFSSLFNNGGLLQVVGIILTAAISGGLGLTASDWVLKALINAGISGVITGVATRNWNAALLAAGSTFAEASVWHGVGDELADADKVSKISGKTQIAEHALVHGMVGGGIQCAEGRNFKDGFIGAATGSILDGCWGDEAAEGHAVAFYTERTVAAAVIGGTAAAATGGNFANGAKTSAMAEMYNALDHGVTTVAESRHKLFALGALQIDVYADTTMHQGDSNVEVIYDAITNNQSIVTRNGLLSVTNSSDGSKACGVDGVSFGSSADGRVVEDVSLPVNKAFSVGVTTYYDPSVLQNNMNYIGSAVRSVFATPPPAYLPPMYSAGFIF